MAEKRLFFLLNVTILILIVLSSCNAYKLFRDSADSIRPVKYHILNDPDRSFDRMKQYHNTVAQLRLWRRYTDEFNDDDDALQGYIPVGF